MGKGKIAAQCCHGAVGVVSKIEENNDELLLEVWRSYGQPKIVVGVNSLGELLSILHNQYPCTIKHGKYIA